MAKIITISITFIILLFSNVWAEPLVVIVNKDNPIPSLSNGDVQKYFLIKIKNWNEGGRVKPINRANKSPEKKEFITSILGMTIQDYEQYWISMKQKTGETEPKVVRSSKFVLRIISQNKEGIGYLAEKYFKNLDRSSKERIKVVLRTQ